MHVRRFDWNDVARQTAQVYAELGGGAGAVAAQARPGVTG